MSGLAPMPDEAVALSAFRVLKNGDCRAYTATTFPKDPWGGCERQLRIGKATGLLVPSGTPDTYALMDVLDANEDIIADYGIPTAGAFRYWKRRLNWSVAATHADDDSVYAPAAVIGETNHG